MIAQLKAREERFLQAYMLGASRADVERYERLAVAFGPRTTLPNTALYEAIWFIGKHRLGQGLPLIPTNAEHWAGELWLHCCHIGLIASWDVGSVVELRSTAVALWSELC